MYKNLRIIFTVLSAICLTAAIPLGIFFDFVDLIGALLGAGIFFLLMLLCKQSQEFAEAKQGKLSKSNPSDGNDDNDDNDGQENGSERDNAPSPSGATSSIRKPRRYRRNKP